MAPIWAYVVAMPPEVAGVQGWVLNGLSVGALVSFILMGLATSRLWTKRQVDILREDHTKAITTLDKQHDREVGDLKDRYETHLKRTIEMWAGRAEDAIRREGEWRDVADRWQQTAETLGGAVDGMQDQSATTLAIVQEMQAAQRASRSGGPG